MSSPHLRLMPDSAPCCPTWLIDAVREVVHHSPARVAEMVPRIISATGHHLTDDILYMWATSPANRSGKHRCMPLRWAVPLTQAAGHFALVDALERQVGRGIPSQVDQREVPLADLALQAITGMGQAIQHGAKLLASRPMPHQDLYDLVRGLEQLRQVLDAAIAAGWQALERQRAA